jgi:prepilin-type N-terminal cleavage/methylation domain-containing protein
MRKPLRASALSGVRPPTNSRLSGFTLIELLTVIAIIGILAAIVIPTVGTVREKAQRAVDANSAREILKAAQIYAGDNQDRLPDPQPASIPNSVLTAAQLAWKWPGILAKNNILTDPSFYFAKNDPAFNGTYPQFIIQPSAQRNTLNTQFTTGRSPSWEFVGGVKMGDVPTTPVLYTRGLTSGGVWNVTSGVYKSTGGFIAFLGGNVGFYSSITNATSPFVSNNPSSTSTTRPIDIRQAIPLNGTAATTNSARIYGIPPPAGGGGMIGSANGTLASRGP